MPLVHLVLCLALLEFGYFIYLVGTAREKYKVMAPAVAGNEMFERYFRVQMNTLEQLVIFIPALLLFGQYISAYVAAGLGLLFVIGRLVYLSSYVKDPKQRSLGFGISALPLVILLFGALYGAARAWLLTR